ncbi:MAG: hypothetical protein WD709_04755 [Gammaproteobacteria bacterium]
MNKVYLALIFLLFAFPVQGQENGEDEETVTQETPASGRESGDEETIITGQEGQSESFIPSEIISEDLSVPFPVDI